MEKNSPYKLEQIKSASDLEALIIIYEQMLENLESAAALFDEKNHESCQEKIAWTLKALEGLTSILNFNANAQLAGNLYRIYEYVNTRLTVAKSCIRQTPQLISESREILAGLKESWEKVRDSGDVTLKFRTSSTSEEKNLLNIKI